MGQGREGGGSRAVSVGGRGVVGGCTRGKAGGLSGNLFYVILLSILQHLNPALGAA